MERPIAEAFAAPRLARGVCRTLAALGYGTLTEFSLITGRRVDVIAINAAGETVIVEIKTSPADLRADHKWVEYLDFCDLFYFAVPVAFPVELVPPDCGLMVADDYGAEILRQPPRSSLPGSRRRAQLLRIALVATSRLAHRLDPETNL
jgi:hypothetical protein